MFFCDSIVLKKKTHNTKKTNGKRPVYTYFFFFYIRLMKMRNPLKPKKKSRRFAELQEDRGFTDAQFETTETPSKVKRK